MHVAFNDTLATLAMVAESMFWMNDDRQCEGMDWICVPMYR
jgi:hypothetical protein